MFKVISQIEIPDEVITSRTLPQWDEWLKTNFSENIVVRDLEHVAECIADIYTGGISEFYNIGIVERDFTEWSK